MQFLRGMKFSTLAKNSTMPCREFLVGSAVVILKKERKGGSEQKKIRGPEGVMLELFLGHRGRR